MPGISYFTGTSEELVPANGKLRTWSLAICRQAESAFSFVRMRWLLELGYCDFQRFLTELDLENQTEVPGFLHCLSWWCSSQRKHGWCLQTWAGSISAWIGRNQKVANWRYPCCMGFLGAGAKMESSAFHFSHLYPIRTYFLRIWMENNFSEELLFHKSYKRGHRVRIDEQPSLVFKRFHESFLSLSWITPITWQDGMLKWMKRKKEKQ